MQASGSACYAGLTLSAIHVHRTKGVPTGAYGAVFDTPNRAMDTRSTVSLGHVRELTPNLALSAQVLSGKADYLGVGAYPGAAGPRITNIDGDHLAKPVPAVVLAAAIARLARREAPAAMPQ